MCTISDKLKLCTCNTQIDKLKNTWVYHRHTGHRKSFTCGEMIVPVNLDPEIELSNRERLTKMLNDGNVFDVEITPKYRDRLLLSFNLSESNKRDKMLYYEFTYGKRGWKPSHYDSFYYEDFMKLLYSGKVVNGILSSGKKE